MLNNSVKINKLFILLLLFGFILPFSSYAQQIDNTLPWPKFHKDIRNTGKTSNLGTTVGKLKWEFKTGAEVVSSPALDNTTVYFGSDDKHVYAVDQKSGLLKWKYQTGEAVRSSPAIDTNGMLYIGSNDGYLYKFNTGAIDPDDQSTWKPVQTGGWPYKYSASSVSAITSPPTLDPDGNLYFGSNDGYLYSLDVSGATVALNWRQPIGTSWGCPAIDLETDRIFIGSWDAGLYFDDNDTFYGYDSFYILNTSDGSRATYNYVMDNGTVITGYPYVEPGFNCVPGGIQASPVLTSDGSVIVSWLLTYGDWPDWCDDDFSENPVWKIPTGRSSGYTLPLGGSDTFSTPAMIEDNSYFVSSGPEIYKILPDGGTYYSVATIGNRSECSPAVDGQLNIFVGSNGGYFYAICADCPETPILWQYPEVGNPLKKVSVGGTETIASIISSPAIGNDDRHSVYVGASDGSLYAFYDGLAISGTVSLIDSGASTSTPLSGVTVYLTDETDTEADIRETQTLTDGTYMFPGVTENHTYTVTVEKLGYIFNPVSKSVSIRLSDMENVDFEAFEGKTISGNIAYASGTGVSGVSVTLVSSTGAVSDSTITDASGDYEFNGLSFDTYTITPTMASTGFTPPYQQVVIAATDPLSQNYTADFVATSGFQISGTVIDNVTESGIAGATVTLTASSGPPKTQTTDTNGAYSFVGLSAGTYTITPSYQNYKFSPASESKTIVASNIDNVNFYAATGFTISGYIFDGTSPMDNATTVELYSFIDYFLGEEPIRTTTSDNGFYSLIGVANGYYVVRPVLSGYSFDPATRPVMVFYDDSTSNNFTAISGLSISGKVTSIFQLPYADVQVTLSGDASSETFTNSSGQYIFTGLSVGQYTVSVSDDAYDIMPASLSVVIDVASADNKNFTASPICPVVYLNLPPFGPQGMLVNIYGINFGDRDPSGDEQTVTVGDTGVSVTPGVYFGYSDPATWIKADVIEWRSWRILADAPGGLGLYNVWVVTVDDDGSGCVYQTPYPTNIFLSY